MAGTLLASKHARKFGGDALQIGDAALLGGLAYKAWSNDSAGKPPIPQCVSDMLGDLIPGQAGAPQGASGNLFAHLPYRCHGKASPPFCYAP